MSNQYITVREAAQMLHVSEKAVLDLVENQKLKAYKIADKFLRLKREEVAELHQSKKVTISEEPEPYSFWERIADFFYYNDFYIVSFLIICGLVYWILFR